MSKSPEKPRTGGRRFSVSEAAEVAIDHDWPERTAHPPESHPWDLEFWSRGFLISLDQQQQFTFDILAPRAVISQDRAEELSHIISGFVAHAASHTWTEIGANLIRSSLGRLQEHVQHLSRGQHELAERLSKLESVVAGELSPPPIPVIDWQAVFETVSQLAAELQWNVHVSFDHEARYVRLEVAADQQELVAETTFAFYERFSQRLGAGVLKAISFDFDVRLD